jgi:hypothetical protein
MMMRGMANPKFNNKAYNLEIKLNYLLLQSERISFDKTELGFVWV